MSELDYASGNRDPLDEDEDAPHAMYCLYCGVHATTPDDYPYCSVQCGIDAERDE